MRLVDAVSNEPGGPGPEGQDRMQFSLLFRGPSEPLLPQGTYVVTHDAIGEQHLFLVPIGRDAEGCATRRPSPEAGGAARRPLHPPVDAEVGRDGEPESLVEPRSTVVHLDVDADDAVGRPCLLDELTHQPGADAGPARLWDAARCRRPGCHPGDGPR